MDIDVRKLIEQDPQFKAYASEALLAMFLETKITQPMVGSIYSFYQMGLSKDQVVMWWKNQQLFTPDNK